MLPERFRLRHSTDVNRVRQQGQSWHHPFIVLLVCSNGLDTSRFAFVASRRVGNAVQRNRCKRLLRESVRHRLPVIMPGWDCLFIARHPLPTASFVQANEAVGQLLERATLLLGDVGEK